MLQENPHFKRLFAYVEGLRRTADDIEADIYERGRLLLESPDGLSSIRRPRKKSTRSGRRSFSKKEETSKLAEHLKSKTWGPSLSSAEPETSAVAGGECKRSCVRDKIAASSKEENEDDDAEALAAAELEKEIEGLLDVDGDDDCARPDAGENEEPLPMGAELPESPGVAEFLQTYGKQDPGVDPLEIMGIAETDDDPRENGEYFDSDYDEE